MEKNPYSMAKLGLEAKDSLKPKRDCGFYVKYFFLFLSLIQFLIILGLVLFMVYGNPQEGTEKRLEGLTGQLEQCHKKAADLSAGIGDLKRQVNASRLENLRAHQAVTRNNVTLRACNYEKGKLMEQQRSELSAQTKLQQCNFDYQLLNMTCPAKLDNLQAQLKTQALRVQVSEETHARETQAFQEIIKAAEKEKKDCQLEKMQVQTRGQTYRRLESQVLATIEPMRQSMRSTVEHALSSSQLHSCYDVRQLCLGIPNTLQGQFESLGRQLDQKVNDVAQKNADLERDKAACGHKVQERELQLASQQQQCEREKLVLREAQDAETKRLHTERQKLLGEKEELQTQLEKSREVCIRIKSNPLAPGNTAMRYPASQGSSGGTKPLFSFLGTSMNTGGVVNPIGGGGPVLNTYGNPGPAGGRVGQPSSSSQGNLSEAQRARWQELLKEKQQSQSPGVPSSG